MDPVQPGSTPSVAQWTQFFMRLGLTDEVESLVSIDEIKKICVVCRHLSEEWEPMFFLYCIDLSSARKDGDYSVQSLQPLLQFDASSGSRIYREFVVLGSKLVMFGQLDQDKDRWTRDWCFYDFNHALCSFTPILVKEQDFVRGSQRMRGRKFHPVVAMVDSYRICVFATKLDDLYWSDEKYAGTCEPPNFEVLDTKEMKWTQLPEPIIIGSKRELEKIEITSYYTERSCLIICTYVGIYGINLDDVNPKWDKLEGSERIERGLFLDRWELVGKNMCYPFEVLRWGEIKSYPFAKSSVVTGEGYGAMCSKRDGESIVLCRVQSTFVPGTHNRALLVKIFKLSDESVENLRGDMWKTIESEKSARYAVESWVCYKLEILGCFEFKDTATKDDDQKKSMDTKRAGKTKKGNYSGERPSWR